MYRAFSYNGKRQMSKQIIEGIAAYVNIPDGGKGIDVGCGSGALTIACAKRNPKAKMIGIDRCDKQLRVLKKGGSFAIHDIMSKSRYGDMQAFAKKLKDMGYAEVKLIDTTNGVFMSRFEALWMELSGSTILVGRK